MGWGLDVLWSTLGLRMGYVDATPIKHFGPVAASYAVGEERERVDSYLQRAEIDSVYDLVGTLDYWRKWELHAPWVLERH